MKKIITKVITFLAIILLTFSLTTFAVLAAEPTEAFTEAQTETMTEAPTESITYAPTNAPTEQKTDSPTEEQGTLITAGMVFAIGNRVIKLINKHKTFITSALSTVSSLVLALIVAKFKSRLNKNNKKNESSVAEIKEENKNANEKFQAQIDEIKVIVNEGHKMIENMVASYEKERADCHAADATAEIDHELATMIHQLIMQSKVGMNVKEQADKVFAESEIKIQKIMEEAKKERGEHHGGEHQSANG